MEMKGSNNLMFRGLEDVMLYVLKWDIDGVSVIIDVPETIQMQF
jgi:hypothetical protein